MSEERSKGFGWGRRLMVGAVVVVLIGYTGFKVVQHGSDGPLNDMIPGGALRAGPLVTEADIDWAAVLGEAGGCSEGICAPMEPVELALEGPGTSRWTGIMVHDGTLYVPCDLGYMWGRFEGPQARVLQLIYLFKDWHERALEDGRAMVRINGTRYTRQAVKVEDAQLEAALKRQLEDMARRWVAPEPLADAPTEGPRDIWFFRMDPRGAT